MLPPSLQKIQKIANKCWTVLNLHYPWYPEKYGDKQLCVTNDGFVQLRLEVLNEEFTKFRIMSTSTPDDKEYPLIYPQQLSRLSIIMKLDKMATVASELIGREMNLEQLERFVEYETNYWNSKLPA